MVYLLLTHECYLDFVGARRGGWYALARSFFHDLSISDQYVMCCVSRRVAGGSALGGIGGVYGAESVNLVDLD